MNNQGVISNPQNIFSTNFKDDLSSVYSSTNLLKPCRIPEICAYNIAFCYVIVSEIGKRRRLLVYYRNLFGIWFASGDFTLHTLFVIAWS